MTLGGHGSAAASSRGQGQRRALPGRVLSITTGRLGVTAIAGFTGTARGRAPAAGVTGTHVVLIVLQLGQASAGAPGGPRVSMPSLLYIYNNLPVHQDCDTIFQVPLLMDFPTASANFGARRRSLAAPRSRVAYSGISTGTLSAAWTTSSRCVQTPARRGRHLFACCWICGSGAPRDVGIAAGEAATRRSTIAAQ